MKKTILSITLAVLVLVTLAGCGRSSSEASAPSKGGEYLPPAQNDGSSSEQGKYTGGSDITLPNDDQRMIVRTGSLTIKVDAVLDTRDKIAVLATGLGGYVVGTNIFGDGVDARGSITIRVPGDKFEEALTEIRKLAVKINSENTGSQDVTEEYVDLQARLTNAQATEKQYLDLLQKATTVEETLKVYDALSHVRQDIETLQGRIQYLERTTSMSDISIYMEPVSSNAPIVESWSAPSVVKSAVRGLIALGKVLLNVLIWVLVFTPAWGLVLFLVWYFGKKRRARAQAVAPVPPESRPR
jgi:predicted small lipoprotein YifL